MIDELIKYHVLDLNKLILKIYPKLDLKPNEAVMLLHLLSNYEQNGKKIFPLSYKDLKDKTGMDKKENGILIKALIDKSFIDITLEKNKDKEQESINITNTINIIENYLEKEKREDENKLMKQNISDICNLFEVNLGRTLSPNEINLLYQNSKFYKKADFERAIFEISRDNDITVSGCIDLLKTQKFMEEEVNKENEKAVLDFFERINKKS